MFIATSYIFVLVFENITFLVVFSDEPINQTVYHQFNLIYSDVENQIDVDLIGFVFFFFFYRKVNKIELLYPY
jgi:hypothetical protein